MAGDGERWARDGREMGGRWVGDGNRWREMGERWREMDERWREMVGDGGRWAGDGGRSSTYCNVSPSMGLLLLASSQVSTQSPLVLVIRSRRDPMSVLLLDTEEFVLLVDTKEEGELLDSL